MQFIGVRQKEDPVFQGLPLLELRYKTRFQVVLRQHQQDGYLDPGTYCTDWNVQQPNISVLSVFRLYIPAPCDVPFSQWSFRGEE